MNLTADQQSPQLIESLYHRRRRVFAVVVILVVIIGLLVSIFTQPSINTQEQQSGNITRGLIWVGQIIISFIAVLSSIVELTGVNVRDLFSSRVAKTNVEEFPFYVFQDYDKLLDYLFPDPKAPVLSDRNIKYLPQISAETDAALHSKGMVLIRGRSKTGKTREACEMLKRWWYSGPTVLVVRSHVGLYPPFKIPENLPLRNLVIFFDDFDRYLGEASALKRLDETIKFFQEICHNRGEVRVIVTARQEEEFWDKLKFDTSQAPWNKFELVQLNPLSSEKALEIINELSRTSKIAIEPELAKTLAEKNNGTFLNLALAFRGWLSQNIKTITSEEIKTFEGSLKNTWRRRYEELAASYPSVKPIIYATIDFMQFHNISLRPELIIELATEMAMSKRLFSAMGLIDRSRYWFDMSSMFNWYRDVKRRHKGWIIISIVGILMLYLLINAFLSFVSVYNQIYIFVSFMSKYFENPSFLILCLLPLWILLIPFMLYPIIMTILQNLALRRSKKALEFLLSVEVPTRGSEIRPYENQFEGNGSTNNWKIQNYAGEIREKKFVSYVSQRVTNRYLELAEQLRINGEFSSARKLTVLAEKISPHHPLPLFMQGKIELGEGNFQVAIELLNASEKLYEHSNNVSRVQEVLALCYFLLNDYKRAELLAEKALKRITDLITATWILTLVQVEQGNEINNIQETSNRPIPIEIQKSLVVSDMTDKKWFGNIQFAGHSFNSKGALRQPTSVSGRAFLLSFACVISLLYVMLFYCVFSIGLGFVRVNGSSAYAPIPMPNIPLAIFPRSPILYFQRGDRYFYLKNYGKAIADYAEAIRLAPKIASMCENNTCFTAFIGLNLNPNDAIDYRIRGYAYYSLDEYGKAIANYTEAIRLDPKFSKTYFARGDVYYYGFRDYENATVDYAESIRLDPNLANGCGMRISCYTAIIDLNPNDAQAYGNRGHAYYDVGEYEKAIVDWKEAINLAHNKSDIEMISSVIFNLISNEARVGHIEQALDLLSQFKKLLPVKDTYLNEVCWFGSLWGDAAQVLDECEQAVLSAPNDAAIRDSRGLARALTGDLDGAILDFQYFVGHSNDGDAIEKRKQWISELQKGNNPFTPEVLESLK